MLSWASSYRKHLIISFCLGKHALYVTQRSTYVDKILCARLGAARYAQRRVSGPVPAKPFHELLWVACLGNHMLSILLLRTSL